MKYAKFSNHRGITLIELLLTLGLVGIIMSLIFTFFLSNLETFNRCDDYIELQYQGQIAMNYIVDRIIKCQGINEVRDISNIDVTNNSGDSDIKKIIFKTEDNNGEIFELKSNNKLFHGLGLNGSATTEVANFISKITVKASPEGEKFKDAKSIIIKMYLKRDDEFIELESQVYFRNYN